MKKIVYAILACIIIVGIILTLTVGLNADIMYSKNVQLNVYVGKQVNIKEVKEIAKEIFPNERMIVQTIELFDDMFAITLPEKSDKDLKEPIEQLNKKINEKYGTEHKVDEIEILHNPKIRLSSLVQPYILPIAISAVIILLFVAIRYKKIGSFKTMANYVVYTVVAEAVYISLIAITRIGVNRLVIPIGLTIAVAVVTILGFKNEQILETKSIEEQKINN